MKHERTAKKMENLLSCVAHENLVVLLRAAALQEEISQSEFIRLSIRERAERVLRQGRRPMVTAEPRPAA